MRTATWSVWIGAVMLSACSSAEPGAGSGGTSSSRGSSTVSGGTGGVISPGSGGASSGGAATGGAGGVAPDPEAIELTDIGMCQVLQLAGNGSERIGGLSADGRFVAFSSSAVDLVDADTNGVTDVFVYDRHLKTTERVNVSSSGEEASGVELKNGGGKVVAEGSTAAGLSADGRLALFYSTATNLVADDANGITDVFVHDRITGTTALASRGSEAEQLDPMNGDHYLTVAAAISANGHHVAFRSMTPFADPAPCLGIYTHEVTEQATGLLSFADGCSWTISGSVSVSADGGIAAYTLRPYFGSTGSVYVTHGDDGSIETVSVRPDGGDAQGDLGQVDIAADGSVVAFASEAGDLIADDGNLGWDIFVRDLSEQVTTLISIAADGGAANGPSQAAMVSGKGRFVVFESGATNLVEGDTNGATDVFVRDGTNGETARVSLASGCVEAGEASTAAAISDDGVWIAFHSSTADGPGAFIVRNPLADTTDNVTVSPSPALE